MSMFKKPTIGRIVIYRTDGRNGLSYDLPAIINCTRDTHPGDYPDGSQNPLPVPESDERVHLTVFTPGGFGTTITKGDALDSPLPRTPYSSSDFKDARDIHPGSGTYVEWNVPFAGDVNAKENRGPHGREDSYPRPRTWRWPVIR
jgi:hypothetical protein